MIKKHGLTLWVAVLIAMLIAPLARAAEPLLISEAYWVDESGRATLNEAVNAPFVSFEGSISKGYKPVALWVKVTLSGQDASEKLALIVRPAFIRQIELYDPYFHNSNQPLIPLISGRDAIITHANHIGLNNGFVIQSSKEPRDLFLRITTTTSLIVDIDVQSLDDADNAGHLTAGTLSIYFAFLLVFLLWSLVNWAVRRDLIYALFALRLLFSMLHMFVWFGLLRYFFSGNLNASVRDHIYNLVFICVTAVAASFDFKLISEFGVPRWLQKVAWTTLSLSAVCLLLLLLGKTQSALQLNSLAVLICMVMNVILSFSTSDKDLAPYGRLAINTIRFGFLLMAIVVIVPVLIVSNVLQISVPLLKVVFLHAAISTVILFAILTIRARQKDLLAQQSFVQYAIKERELRQESERRAEKERFLSMLVHELRNPLSVIRLKTSENSAGGKAVHQAVLEMAQIIERVEQSETLDHADAHGKRTSVDLGSVLREIAAEHPASPRVDIDAPTGLVVETDEDLLRRIVKNLLDNAWKYSPDASVIVLAASGRSHDGVDGVKLNVLNEVGEAGVPDAGKLFTKYYRSKGAHRRPGSGLGLFLVASWAKALGGNVGYEEIAAANGNPLLCFSLWLPK
jgi:signal transduction histidine kinase